MASKKISRNERYMLKRGALKKSGFDCWRLVTNAANRATGEEKRFFVEFYIVNPALSPKECVLGFKSRITTTEADLHSTLEGSPATSAAGAEVMVQPSFVMVKAGVFCVGGKHINRYFPSSQLESGKSEFIVKVGSGNDICILTDSGTSGSVSVLYRDLDERPELLCNPGTMKWNLRFEKQVAFVPDYKGKGNHWACVGACTVVGGAIMFDGQEYIVNPKTSFGYLEKKWGRSFASPFFHLNSSNLISLISRKPLAKSCFAVQGVYENRLSVLICTEGRHVEFHADSHKKYQITWDCSEMPEDNEGVKLHWTVSVHNRKTVVDIDVFCPTNAMFIRDYESPEGGRKVLKVLGGGTGTGEIRIYHKIKKNLELLEHARVSNVVCEYGNIELPAV
ncbi:MAG: hypothetical protein J1D88_05945 [Treponema sp.]|nr:hypothetical protein [Treponema sp.]